MNMLRSGAIAAARQQHRLLRLVHKSLAELFVTLVLVLTAGIGCASDANREAACTGAVALLDEMAEAEQFPRSGRLEKLNAELGTIDASGDVAPAIEWVSFQTSEWVKVVNGEVQGDRGFEIRADLTEARLALRRICR